MNSEARSSYSPNLVIQLFSLYTDDTSSGGIRHSSIGKNADGQARVHDFVLRTPLADVRA